MMTLAFVVGAVIVTSAMCSLFEAVLYAVPRSHIEALVNEGRAAGRILRDLSKNVERPISAILSLNTFANTAGAAAAGALASVVLGEKWLAAFSAAFTLGILVLSEVLPKTAGVVYCRMLSTWIARPLLILVRVLRPAIWLCSIATRMIPKRGTEADVSEEEIVTMTRLGSRKGSIEQDKATAVQNVLFLDQKVVAEIMTPRTVLFSLPEDATVRDAADDPKTFVHSRIPIYAGSEDDVTGLVVRRDLFEVAARGDWDTPLKAIARPAKFISEKAHLGNVLRTILGSKQHMLIVVDEWGGIAGVVTLEDVIEEILGKEIVDEYDEVEDMRELAERHREKINPAFVDRPKRSADD